MRNIKKLIALVLALCMALSLMAVTAYAEDDVRSEIGPPIAAPTQAELEEAELTARALAETAKYLKLSVTQMNLKAGETYSVRIVPSELAKMFDWKIDEEGTKSSNAAYLSVQEIDQQSLTITFKAEKSGRNVSLGVKLSNSRMDELVAMNPALAKYATAAQKTLSNSMTCKVTTVNTETKVVAGVGVTTTAVAPVVRPSGGGGVTVLPPSSGGDSVTPPATDPDNPDNPGGEQPEEPAKCEHGKVAAECPICKCDKKDAHATLPKGEKCPGNCGYVGTYVAPVSGDVTLAEDKVNIADVDGVKTTTADVDDVAAVDAAITAAKDARGEGNADAPLNVVIDVTAGAGDKADATNVTLSKDVVDALLAAEGEDGNTETIMVTVNSDTGTVQLPLDAIKAASDKTAADGAGNVSLAVAAKNAADLGAVTDPETGKKELTVEGTGEKVDLTDAVILDVTLEIDGKDAEVAGLDNKIQITVSAPAEAEKVDVYFVKDGVLSVVQKGVAVDSDGKATFGTSHLTEFVVTDAEETVEPTPPSHTPDECPDKVNHDSSWKCDVCGATGTKVEEPDVPATHVHKWQNGVCSGEGVCSGCSKADGHDALGEGESCSECGLPGKGSSGDDGQEPDPEKPGQGTTDPENPDQGVTDPDNPDTTDPENPGGDEVQQPGTGGEEQKPGTDAGDQEQESGDKDSTGGDTDDSEQDEVVVEESDGADLVG